MKEPTKAERRARLEARAERVREAFRKMPVFLETLQASQEAEKAGRYVTHEEVVRKYVADE